MSRAGKRGRRSSAGSLDSNMEGSIISSPHVHQRAVSSRDGPSRGHPPVPNSSSSLLGTLFGSRRGKPPPSSSHGHPHHSGLQPPTLISHTPHHSSSAEPHPHHPQFCHAQKPPPYHHHHHYHPPHQFHQRPPFVSHAHIQHSHSAHSQHAPHHHSQLPGPVPAGGSKPKHSGISTVV
ncbi:IQ motif and SEC7 domain-containing protein 1-like [Arapaima gigas]